MMNKKNGKHLITFYVLSKCKVSSCAVVVLLVGLLCLLYCPLRAATQSQSNEKIGFDSSTLQADKKILIVYESKHGSTREYVNKLGEELRLRGYHVDIDRYQNVYQTDLSTYDGVVLSSAIYWGSTIPQLKKFLEMQGAALRNKPIAYLHNALEEAESGNSGSFSFWLYCYTGLFSQYNDIFHLTEHIDNQMPPNGACDLSIDPLYGYPKYENCDTPFWVGLMPGRYDPREAFPLEYMAMEIFGFGGYKDFLRLEAATEFAETLDRVGLFDGACTSDNILPTVTATANPINGKTPLEVNFSAEGSDEDGTIISYLWKFGDGNISDEQNISHTYTCPGDYTVKLQVMDNNCGIATELFDISVKRTGGGLTYECDVAPVLTRRCIACHGTAGGITLKTCDDLAAGGDSGYVVIPGNKAASLLFHVMAGDVTQHPPTTVTLRETLSVGNWIDSLDPDCSPSEVCSCPSINVNLCPFEVVLGNENAGLKTYRRLRDTVFNKSKEGESIVQLFNKSVPEISAILMLYPDLRRKALKLITEALPAVEQIISNKSTTIDESLMEKIRMFIDSFAKVASNSLKSDLEKIQDDLDSGRIMKSFGIASGNVE